MLNRVTLVGELAGHPFRSTDRGRPCLRLQLCPRGIGVDVNGHPRARGDVLPIVVFEDAARGLGVLRPGSRISVEGRLRVVVPDVHGGPPVSVLGVEALKVEFLRLGRPRTGRGG